MMKKSIQWFVVLIIVGLVSVLFRMAYAQQETQPMKIAVVNVGKVLSECRENLNRESESEVRSQEIQAELKRLERGIGGITLFNATPYRPTQTPCLARVLGDRLGRIAGVDDALRGLLDT